ncbi:MAG: tetratricopeptide repeat protein [Acidobacteriota bacterium]
MERRWPLDAARRTAIVAVCFAASLRAQTPDAFYNQGLAQAQQQHWDQARTAFLAGQRANPSDARFPLELGGVAFKQKRNAEAAKWLRRALHRDPSDTYTAEFLATVYFLEGNLDAALKYWNPIGKPHITALAIPPSLRVDPILLDHAFRFSPAATLQLSDLRATRARLDALGIFPSYRIRLDAQNDQQFSARFDAAERNGFGSGKLNALVSTFRGIGYQAIRPEYYNLANASVNVESLLRWDSNKRRGSVSVSGPLRRDARYRYHACVDVRDENWNLQNPASKPLGSLHMRRVASSAAISSAGNGLWSWTAGGEFSHRNPRDIQPWPAAPASTLVKAFQLKQSAQLRRTLLVLPEHRFTSSALLSTDVAKLWTAPSRVFSRVQLTLDSLWLPRISGEDYATHLQTRAGKIFGQAPFDELFMLGMERDNDLWLRAHVGSRDGRKGSAPLGQRYFAATWDVDKILYDNGLLSLRLSPFFDVGSMDSSVGLGSRKWLFDTGLQAKVRILGVGFAFIYGKDLRTGNNVFYIVEGR